MGRYRLGVDIGGTFTDFSLLDQESGELLGLKTPTVPRAPAEGVANGLRTLIERGIDPGQIDAFVHGTTIAVNAIIQRTGARLGLFVTEGHRDVLALQRLRLPNPFDFNSARPEPLVLREHIFEIGGRLWQDGREDRPLDEASVERAVRRAVELGLEGLVVCLINAYRDPSHEHRCREIARRLAPGLQVTCSTDVWPQMREYERAVASTIHAYVQPKVAAYLDALGGVLTQHGVHAPAFITRSNGGIMSAAYAKDYTAETLLSGPASGVIGAAFIGRQAGLDNLITFDMGGTSADIALIRDGEPLYSKEEHIGDFPVILPAVGVSSIGAGGGSIAWVDPAGVLKVGPDSAGADPGPACYGRGGTRPTLSDAFLVSGLLNPDNFGSGTTTLRRDLAEQALATLGSQLGLSVEDTAESIIYVATANMYTEFSNLISQWGIDPRDFSLVAFGGAGPLPACLLAREFNIGRVLIAPSPGTLCAFGALSADVKSDYIQSLRLGTRDLPAAEFERLFQGLTERALERVAGEAAFTGRPAVRRAVDMRYIGQSFEIEVALDPAWPTDRVPEMLNEAFHREHHRAYGHADPHAPAEIVNLRVRLTSERPKPRMAPAPTAGGPLVPRSERQVRLEGRVQTAWVYLRDDLLPGHRLVGPAIVEQADTTVLIPDGFEGSVDPMRNLLVEQSKTAPAALAERPRAIDEHAEGVTLEVLRNYYRAIVEAMGRVIERTAYTTFVKESADFAVGLVTPEGEIFCYPKGIGVTGFVAIDHTVALKEIGPCQPGDLIITNDPYATGGAATHLPDIQVYKPIFHDGELVCFAWSFCHASDVGGIAPASISPGCSEIYQEGLRIPPSRLFRAGVLDEGLVNLIKANCRIPEQNWGDIKAMVAALNTAERRVAEMIGKFGEQRVRRSMPQLLEYAARRAGDIIESIPDGTYSFVDFLDDDVVSAVPIRMSLTMRVRGRELEMDFAGTDPQVNSAFNIPTDGRLHPFLCVGLVAFFMTVDPHIPLNGGLVRPVTMKLPRGSLVNPEFPAACGVRYATAIRGIDLVFGTLIQALPDKVPAAGGGQGCMVVCSLLNPDTGRREVQVVEPIQGGAGAMLEKDGMGGTYYCAGLRNTPIEMIETHLPILVRRYHQVMDSGGPGRRHGGHALRLDFQVFSPGGIVTARGMERYRFQPWGAVGGWPGQSGRTLLNPDTDRTREIGKINILHLEPGDVVSIWSPAGGGYGHPAEREPELVLRDVLDDLVSPEAAREVYRVEIRDGRIDREATAALRAGPAEADGRGFRFGPAREARDRIWSPAVAERCLELLMGLPPAIRPFAKAELHRRLSSLGDSRPVEPADVEREWGQASRALRGEVVAR